VAHHGPARDISRRIFQTCERSSSEIAGGIPAGIELSAREHHEDSFSEPGFAPRGILLSRTLEAKARRHCDQTNALTCPL